MSSTDLELINISSDSIRQIKSVPDFARNDEYKELDIEATLRYMKALYINQMTRYIDIHDAVLCDCAAGYGWLGLAFLLCGGKKAIFVEPIAMKLNAIRRFADILNLSDKCEFRSEYLQDIPLNDRSIDIFASVETLEHVGRDNVELCIKNMDRLTTKMIIITTPNRFFPVVSHDSVFPFAHWLPIKWRDCYLGLFDKQYIGHNHFLSPFDFRILKKRFKTVSSVLTFESFDEWRNHYPFYSPYGRGRWKNKPGFLIYIFLRTTSLLFGVYSYKINPNLASVWLCKSINDD